MRAFAQTLVALVATAAALAVVSPAPATAASGPRAASRTEVVVTLGAPGLADAIASSRALSARAKRGRLDLQSPTSVSYLRELAAEQAALARRIVAAIPSARIRWRYRVVLDGLAVSLPTKSLRTLRRIRGVASVYPSSRYTVSRAALDTSPELIGADQLWGLPSLTTAGNGIKIGIVDDGVDQSHTFFDPSGYTYPPGFPKGDLAYTTPKVIVARAFAPASAGWKYARQPFDPVYSDHGTHVAGIAAGNYGAVGAGRGPLSGVAPKAYIGNYKALTVPTREFGLDGNTPELAAAVEAAVRDGMDVINLSLGEPEITPARDVLVAAIEGAAKAGVVPVVAAGNDFDAFGRGSISSPGSAPDAITVAAVSKSDTIASFSSSGPTPISLELKPDVSAPGVSILSSVPARAGTWTQFSGTSMASPHVAGAAALLRERHPTWSVEQIKSALVLTAEPVYSEAAHVEVPTTREGGGLVDLPRADNPLVFTRPATVSFGLVKPGSATSRTIAVADAGGGAGVWQAAVQLQNQAPGVTVSAPATVAVPGSLQLQARVDASASDGDLTGFLVLKLGGESRRIPFWLHVENPRLGAPTRTLTAPGVYQGNARSGQARVASYRYPDAPGGAGVSNDLPGPEQVFRVRIRGRVANFGVRVLTRAPGVQVTPRVVVDDDENRLTGYAALPLDINQYLATYGKPDAAAGAIAPGPGVYEVVFDTPSAARAGPFTFRFWINDTTRPTARLETRTVSSGGAVRVAVSDAGSGVDPSTIAATIDGSAVRARYAAGTVTVPVGSRLAAGRHAFVLSVSDYQETKNMENVGPILPNTRVLRTTFTVR